MPVRGEWTVDGSAADLRLLSVRLRATGQTGQMRNVRVAIRAATVPVREAVRAELRSVMPKHGGLNEWLASSSITSSVLTGARTAGIVVRGSKRGHDLRAVNRTGQVRHPVFGDRKAWTTTTVPQGWWEHALDPFGPAVGAALRASMNATAREAGFTTSFVGITFSRL